MAKFLSASHNEELAEVASKIEMILMNVWSCGWRFEDFLSLRIVICDSKTLYEISNCYKKIKISGGMTRDNVQFHYVEKCKK